MKYVVDISQEQAKKIEKLIENNKYNSLAQFVATAIVNQIYLEESDVDKFTDIVVSNNKKKEKSFNDRCLKIKGNRPSPVPLPDSDDLVDSLPRLRKNDIDVKYIWLWGQINRIFPVKVGVRTLYNLLGDKQWISLEEFTEKAINIASSLGSIIRSREADDKKFRMQKLSAGLPRQGIFKSEMRYKNHFLAHIRSDDLLDGAMCLLKFANLSRKTKGEILIGLTEPGIKFATITNNIIDDNNFDKSLNEQEVSFYLDHIKKHLPGEEFAFMWLLKKLNEGISDRLSMNRVLKEEIGYLWKSKDWKSSDKFINTQRAGLMARMYELGLILKNKKGLEVRYLISGRGKEYLATKNS